MTKASTPQTKTCRCSSDCAATTKGNFAQGHDARMVSDQAALILAGDQELTGAAQLIREAGGTEALVTKLYAAVARSLDISAKRIQAQDARFANAAQAVMAHARANYNKGGWDVIVETMDLGDIEQDLRLEGISSATRAIRHFRAGAVSIWAERQAEADRERDAAN